MSPAMILALIQGAATAIPALLGLFQRASAGETVTEAEVTAALNDYSVARAQLAAAIASQEPPAVG